MARLLVCPLLALSMLIGPLPLSPSNGPARGASLLPAAPGALTIDGGLSDLIWRQAAAVELEPSEPGVPAALGGRVSLVRSGGELCLAAFLPEPGGRVLARSIGWNPVWEQDAPTSPLVEDLLVIELTPDHPARDRSPLRIEINPWGACRMERDGRTVPSSAALVAARIDSAGWSVELALPLEEVIGTGKETEISLALTRFRSRRPLDPQFRWQSPARGKFARFRTALADSSAGTARPEFHPPQLGNDDPPLRVGRVRAVPPAALIADDPFWQDVPSFRLLRNEPSPREPRYPTEIKWVHDGRRLALLVHCTESSRVDCDHGARDGDLAGDDHLCIYLATSGSRVIEILVNPAGAVRDGLAQGPRAARAGAGAWDGEVDAATRIDRDRWQLRVNLPLDQIAAALGESAVPTEWRVLVGRARQPRLGEPGELSTTPMLGNPFLLAPARFRRLELTGEDPARLDPDPAQQPVPEPTGLAGQLAGLDSEVFSPVERTYLRLPGMLERQLEGRVERLAMQEHREWLTVESLPQWQQFRDRRVERLKAALGEFPARRAPLECRESSVHHGEGYRLHNLAFQSRPGCWVAANLYLPAEPPAGKLPAIVIIPSHHYPKIQGELKDCGMVWARSGCAVLVLETLGYGERVEVNPWNRQPYQSESQLELQLSLVGQSRLGWIAWDLSRAVDLLLARGDIDPERLILIGSVTWGGGRPAAIAGLLEERFAAVVPFNWGRVYWESFGLRRSAIDRISAWFTCAAIAPRRLVYAHEFSWEGEEGHSLPAIDIPAWPRYQRVYRLYGAEGNLASAQGQGLLRVPETMGDCYSLGSVQRRPLYELFHRWFGFPRPAPEDLNLEPDSWLGFGGLRQGLEQVRLKEARRRPPDSTLLSITPKTDAAIERKALHQLAREEALRQLRETRRRLAGLEPARRRQVLADSLDRLLGGVSPAGIPAAEEKWRQSLEGVMVEAVALRPEEGIILPLLLLRPGRADSNPLPVVLALSEEGKDRLLRQRSGEIAELLAAGVAVCLPDVRGTGETAPSQYNRDSYLTDRALDLGETLLGTRVRDVRAVLAYLRGRADLDGRRIALWGESFATANPRKLWVEELPDWPVSPQPQHLSSPLGGQLALLTALFEPEVRAVAARGMLAGYLSLLESNVTYLPFDMTVPGIFAAGDTDDRCAVLAPLPLLVAGAVDGRNRLLNERELRQALGQTISRYEATGGSGGLILRPQTAAPGPAQWLAAQLNGMDR